MRSIWPGWSGTLQPSLRAASIKRARYCVSPFARAAAIMPSTSLCRTPELLSRRSTGAGGGGGDGVLSGAGGDGVLNDGAGRVFVSNPGTIETWLVSCPGWLMATPLHQVWIAFVSGGQWFDRDRW